MKLFDSLTNHCQSLASEFDAIESNRKDKLKILSDYFLQKYQQEQTPKAIVICTHNSRRSHMGQIWLAIAAEYYSLPILESFSGGTEATAFNPRSVTALQKIGIEITSNTLSEKNPLYFLKWNSEMTAYQAFSKKYDTHPNPTTNFAAIMVCTEADKGCPIVRGTDCRLALPFDDPKAFDDTPLEAHKYDERCRQIGREFLFVLNQVKENL